MAILNDTRINGECSADKIISPIGIINSLYRTPKTWTFASGATTYQMNDSSVTANSIVDVYAQGATVGSWSVVSYAWYFIITSSASETSNVSFSYFINNI